MKLLEHHADTTPQRAERIGHIALRRARAEANFVDLHLTVIERFEAVDAAQQRRAREARRGFSLDCERRS
jgi:hypothetical protein